MCSDTPRFSYRSPKLVICACSQDTRHGWSVCMTSRVGTRAGIAGGYQGGYTGGVLPSHQVLRPSGGLTAKRAPEAPAGLEWVVRVQRPQDRSPEHPDPTTPDPAGPPGPLRWVWALSPSKPAFWPIVARLRVISWNLVKTTKCHQFLCKRPVIVPIFQNGSHLSPLEILRFPFPPAFSGKELMVPF